nr:MAG TPA: hypothetical protein [Caudoviricetes sp.]
MRGAAAHGLNMPAERLRAPRYGMPFSVPVPGPAAA